AAAAADARAPPLPGRLADAVLRLRRRRDRARGQRRHARPRHRSEAGVGAAPPRAVPGRPRHRAARAAAAGAGPGGEDGAAAARDAPPSPPALRRPGEAGRVGDEGGAVRVHARSSPARRRRRRGAARGGRATAEAAGPVRPLMRRVELADGADLAQWRGVARALRADGVPPEQVLWQVGAQRDLLGEVGDLGDLGEVGEVGDAMRRGGSPAGLRVPRDFLDLAGLVVAHADPRRHALLYRLLWRIARGERALLAMATDDDVAWARHAAKAVRREKHKMKAFVRF